MKIAFILPAGLLIYIQAFTQNTYELKSALTHAGPVTHSTMGSTQHRLIQCTGQPGVTGVVISGSLLLKQGFLSSLPGKSWTDEGVRGVAKVFPVPFTRVFTLSFEDRQYINFYLRIFDLTGRLIYYGRHDTDIPVDPGPVLPGQYIASVQTDKNIIFLKILKK
jgi:hypothetical protein